MADLFEPLVSFNASIAAIIIYMKRKTKLISAKKFTLQKKIEKMKTRKSVFTSEYFGREDGDSGGG